MAAVHKSIPRAIIRCGAGRRRSRQTRPKWAGGELWNCGDLATIRLRSAVLLKHCQAVI